MTSGGHQPLRIWRVSTIPVTRCLALLRGRESSRSLSLSLRRGIALWTACFAKECLFLDQQRTRERKREERQPWRPPKCNGSWPSLLFVFFFPFSFLSIASFFWVLVCKCKHRHQIIFSRGLEEFSLLARIQHLRMTHYRSVMYAPCLLPWNPSFLEARTQGIFDVFFRVFLGQGLWDWNFGISCFWFFLCGFCYLSLEVLLQLMGVHHN